MDHRDKPVMTVGVVRWCAIDRPFSFVTPALRGCEFIVVWHFQHGGIVIL